MRIQKDWPLHPNVCVTELAGSCCTLLTCTCMWFMHSQELCAQSSDKNSINYPITLSRCTVCWWSLRKVSWVLKLLSLSFCPQLHRSLFHSVSLSILTRTCSLSLPTFIVPSFIQSLAILTHTCSLSSHLYCSVFRSLCNLSHTCSLFPLHFFLTKALVPFSPCCCSFSVNAFCLLFCP